MEQRPEIRKMKEAAWGWTFFAVVLSVLMLTTDQLSVWLMLVVDVFATLIWAVTIMEQDEQKQENSELFNK